MEGHPPVDHDRMRALFAEEEREMRECMQAMQTAYDRLVKVKRLVKLRHEARKRAEHICDY